MNRRGFFGTLAAVALAPKAVKLVAPEAVGFVDFNEAMKKIYTDDYDALSTPIIGLQGWLPNSVAGRMEALVSFHEDGILTTSDFARLVDAAPES